MALPSTILDLGTLTSSNSPLGTDNVGNPAEVDDFFRHVQSVLRNESLLKSWERRGDTPTYVSGTTFQVAGDLTVKYSAGRRLLTYGTSTLYSTIISASYNGSVTTVTIQGDSSGTLDGSLSEVQLGVDPLAVPVSVTLLTQYMPKSGGEFTGDVTFSGNNIYSVGFFTFDEEYSIGPVGSAKTIDWTNGTNQRCTLDSDTVLTILNPPGVGHYQLRMIEDSTGAHTVSFVNLVSTAWAGASSQPGFNQAANGETIISFFWTGSAWRQAHQKMGAA